MKKGDAEKRGSSGSKQQADRLAPTGLPENPRGYASKIVFVNNNENLDRHRRKLQFKGTAMLLVTQILIRAKQQFGFSEFFRLL